MSIAFSASLASIVFVLLPWIPNLLAGHALFAVDLGWAAVLGISAGLVGLTSAALWVRSASDADNTRLLNAAAGGLSGTAVILTVGTTEILPIGHTATVLSCYWPEAADLAGFVVAVAVAVMVSPRVEHRLSQIHRPRL